MNVTVLDFGMGNLRSVAKALERAGATVDVRAQVDIRADALVVPGQGHFGSCVVNLGERLDDVKEWVSSERPFLGICLGLQILFERSEESPEDGLGWFGGEVVRLPDGVKVPHIGWNDVRARPGARLFDGIEPSTRFYFVHSYYPRPDDDGITAGTTSHGVEFCSAVERDNVFATQFHPEKSGDAGHALLGNFLRAL
ncbi:MAG: imidazole glycerol phosphate synthase subunit HisH [Actinomycetota bacterium]|nr:imidazole glycerol phosphate synthase subunit HisH [Actinomycetota bacterium]